jgi:hypothetical protein
MVYWQSSARLEWCQWLMLLVKNELSSVKEMWVVFDRNRMGYVIKHSLSILQYSQEPEMSVIEHTKLHVNVPCPCTRWLTHVVMLS